MNRHSRRSLLANSAVAAATLVPIAGCLSNDDEDTDSESDGASDGGDGSGPDGASNEDDSEPNEESPSNRGAVSQVEVETEVEDAVLYTEDLRGHIDTVVVGVFDEHGDPVTGGRVIVAAGSAQLETPQVAEIGSGSDTFGRIDDTEELASNQVGFGFTHEDEPASEDEEVEHTIGLPSDQGHGTLEIEVIPPPDSPHTDSLRNSEIVVIEGSDETDSDG